MKKKFTFPRWLERSESELAEEVAVQELRRASFGRGQLNPAEEIVSRGTSLEQTARGNLAAIQTDKSAPPISAIGLEARKEELAAQESQELTKLAQALAMQGRYEEAKEHSPDAAMKSHYQNLIDAIEMDDGVKCDCPDVTDKLGETQIAITPRFAAMELFSPKHQRMVSLVVCNRCGHANARVPNSRIPLRNDALANNHAVVATNQPRGLISDIDLLKAQ